MRLALKTAEGLSPSVLWVDEIEKGATSGGKSGSSDGGTAARVFGSLLTWMQEKSSMVFVIARPMTSQNSPRIDEKRKV